MSGAIGKGDWVECIDASPHKATGIAILVVGAIYRVRDTETIREKSGVRLHGVVLPIHPSGKEYGWVPARFRPIYRPRPDAFSDLLKAPTEAPNKEPVAA